MKNGTKLIWVTLLFCGLSNSVFAQQYDIKKLSTNEGLPSGQIGYVLQDSMEFLWLTSYDGLIKYNGFDTEIFTIENGLRNDIVNSVFLDNEHKLWFATEESGVGYLEGDSAYYPSEFAILDTVSVMYITQFDDEMYFSTYDDGLFIWDGETWHTISSKNGLPSNIVWELHLSQNDKVWIATHGGAVVLNRDGYIIEKVYTLENGLSGSWVYSFAEEEDGTIWAATSNGVSVFDGTQWTQITSIDGTPLRYVYDVLVDDSGLVWIGTESDGVFWFDGEEFTHVKKENGLSSNYIYSFYEDNAGRV